MTLSVIFYPYHFVRTILSLPSCPLPFCPHTILSIKLCPYIPHCPLPFCPRSAGSTSELFTLLGLSKCLDKMPSLRLNYINIYIIYILYKLTITITITIDSMGNKGYDKRSRAAEMVYSNPSSSFPSFLLNSFRIVMDCLRQPNVLVFQ